MNHTASRPNSPIGYYTEEALNAEVSNASPHRLVQMLYQGAMERILLASDAIRTGNPQDRDDLIDRAIAIVETLHGSLNAEAGGDLTRDIGVIYSRVTQQLMRAQEQNRADLLDEPHELLAQLKESWDKIPEVLQSS